MHGSVYGFNRKYKYYKVHENNRIPLCNIHNTYHQETWVIKKEFSGTQKQKISAELLCPSMPQGGFALKLWNTEVNNVPVGPAPTDLTNRKEEFGQNSERLLIWKSALSTEQQSSKSRDTGLPATYNTLHKNVCWIMRMRLKQAKRRK